MTKPRIYLACLWGATALFALYQGIAHGSTVAWWLLATLVPSLIVFVWWMVDRAALERRISRLEARSEIGDERRVVAGTDLSKVEHKLQEIESRVAQVEDHEDDAARSEALPSEGFSGHGRGGIAGVDPITNQFISKETSPFRDSSSPSSIGGKNTPRRPEEREESLN